MPLKRGYSQKIVSSIEKIEENLFTGTQQKVDAHNQWGN